MLQPGDRAGPRRLPPLLLEQVGLSSTHFPYLDFNIIWATFEDHTRVRPILHSRAGSETRIPAFALCCVRSSCLAALGRWSESAKDAERSISLAKKNTGVRGIKKPWQAERAV